MKAEESLALIFYRLERSSESLHYSSPDREMVSEYLEKARGFVSNIQEYLQQEDAPPAKR
jgi:hypothetical protein